MAALEDSGPAADLAGVREGDLAGVREAALAEATVDLESAVMAAPEDLVEVADLAEVLAVDLAVVWVADLAVVQGVGLVEATEEPEDTAAVDRVGSLWAARLASAVVLEADSAVELAEVMEAVTVDQAVLAVELEELEDLEVALEVDLVVD